MTSRDLLGPASALLIAAVLTACGGGHGKYTAEHMNKAEARMAEMKSGTEWELARQAYLSGDLDKALKKVDISIALNEKVPKSHVLRGRILLEQGRMDAAIDSFEKALEFDPEFVDAHYYQGIVFERIVRRDEALEHFQKAAELDPVNPQYAIATAETMIDLGRIEDAERFLRDRNEQFEHTAGVRQTLGHIALMTDRPEEAVELFNEARLLSPEDPAIVEDLVRAQILTKRFGDAEYSLSRLISELDKGERRRDLEHMRARCLVSLNRPIEARDMYLGLTEDEAGAADVEAWVGLGKIAFKLRDDNRLRLASTRVVALAPERAEGHLLTALWQHRRGNARAALESLSRVLERTPDDATALTLHALVLQDVGQPQQARASLARALEIDPGNTAVRDLLGQIDHAAIATVPTE